MQNNIITKISPITRIVAFFILTLSLLMAKSIFLILFITTLTLLLFIITNKKVKLYVKIFKKIVLLLLILLLTYIIMFSQFDIFSIFIFAYKLVIISIIITIFILNSNFKSIHEGLYCLLLPLKKLNINIEKISLDVTLSIYFVKFLIESKDKIKKMQIIKGKKIINIKNYLLPRLIYSTNKLEVLQSNLKIQFYRLNYKKTNLLSKIILILSLLMFIICIYKEVIL